MGGKLKTGPKPKPLIEKPDDTIYPHMIHGFFKFRHSFPRKIRPKNFEEDVIALGYDITNLPDRKNRYVRVSFSETHFDVIGVAKREHVQFDNYISIQAFCSDFREDKFDDKLKNALNHFQSIYDELIGKSRKKEKPIDLKFRKDRQRFNNQPTLYAEYIENDDDYFARLKYIKEQQRV